MPTHKTPAVAPKSGVDVIDLMFPYTEEAAKPLTLHPQCRDKMHHATDRNGMSNDDSFNDCFKRGHFDEAEPKLRQAAEQHGTIARLIQQMLDPAATEISLEAYIAAGAAVRQLCHIKCGRGEWCTWP